MSVTRSWVCVCISLSFFPKPQITRWDLGPLFLLHSLCSLREPQTPSRAQEAEKDPQRHLLFLPCHSRPQGDRGWEVGGEGGGKDGGGRGLGRCSRNSLPRPGHFIFCFISGMGAAEFGGGE